MSIEFVYIRVSARLRVRSGKLSARAVGSSNMETFRNISSDSRTRRVRVWHNFFLSSNFHLVAFYATMSIRGIHIALNTFQRFGKYNIR